MLTPGLSCNPAGTHGQLGCFVSAQLTCTAEVGVAPRAAGRQQRGGGDSQRLCLERDGADDVCILQVERHLASLGCRGPAGTRKRRADGHRGACARGEVERAAAGLGRHGQCSCAEEAALVKTQRAGQDCPLHRRGSRGRGGTRCRWVEARFCFPADATAASPRASFFGPATPVKRPPSPER